MSSTQDEPLDPAEPLDAALVAQLYLEHGEEIRRFLIGVLRDPHLAADALQATFVKLVERGHDTNSATRKAWLFRVAYREAMYVRRRGATGDRVLRKVAWSLGSAESTHAAGEDPVVRLETVQQVQAALERLPAEQRVVVRMRIFEEKSFATIAEELNIPLGTALWRMSVALKKLRQLMGEL